MHKYQIAVKSSMDSYVRSAAAEPDVVKGEQQILKRKWEDSGGTESVTLSTVVEKKPRRSLSSANVIQTPKASGGNVTEEMKSNKGKASAAGFRHDTFCWICQTDATPVMKCRQCPRVFHQRCVQLQSPVPPKWLCTECVSVQNAKTLSRGSPAFEQFCNMLTFALDRIKSVADAQPFFKPVDTDQFPHYLEYIVCPVDIGLMEEKVAQRAYNSTRSFLAEFRWILHNCIIFNSPHSKLTSTARTLMKVAKHECAEIDTCADCYIHAHTKRETWFLEPCSRPHLLLWAKLKVSRHILLCHWDPFF